jgi:hypothetical protein
MKEIFISHTWIKDNLNRNNHERCKLLCDNLKKLGYSVWFDHYDMQNSIDNSIMLSINNCKIFLVCLTEAYCNKINNSISNNIISDNCFKEWNYALYKKKIIVPVLMEAKMIDFLKNNDGIIQMYLNTLIYFDITHDNYNVNDFDLLCKIFRKYEVYNEYEAKLKYIKDTSSFNTFLEYIHEANKNDKNQKSNNKIRIMNKKTKIKNIVYI